MQDETQIIEAAQRFARGLISEAYRLDVSGSTSTWKQNHYTQRATRTLRRMATDPSVSVTARAVYAGIVAERETSSGAGSLGIVGDDNVSAR